MHENVVLNVIVLSIDDVLRALLLALEVVHILVEEEDAVRLLISQGGNECLALTEKRKETEKRLLSASCPRKLSSRADFIVDMKVRYGRTNASIEIGVRLFSLNEDE